MSDVDARDVAASLMELNNARDRLFGSEPFGNPAWDVLITLFRNGGEMSAQQLAGGVSCSIRLMERWLSVLADRSLVRVHNDRSIAEYSLHQVAAMGIETILSGHAARLLDSGRCARDRAKSNDAIADAN